MLIINSLEKMKPYYNENTNTYNFFDNGNPIDVCFDFSIDIDSDINALDINAWDINARDIEFYAICYAYENFKCNTIKGMRKNAKYFCLDNKVEFIKEEKQ